MPMGRRVFALVLALLLAGSVASCRGSYDEPAAGDPGSGDGEFPVTIKHTFGETTIPSEPQRIVTLGYSAQDIVYALGKTPVGMPRNTYGANDEGVMPWVEDYYDPEQTTLLDQSDGIPIEAIANLAPDVILAPYDGFYKREYEDLSEIAPTVAYPKGPFQTPWQVSTKMVGQALGMEDEAQKLIEDTNAYLEQIADDHPEFVGKSLSVTYMGSKSIDVYMPTVAMVQMLLDMGMVSSPGVEAMAEEDGGKNFSLPLSWENVSDIDADVIVSFIDDLTEEQIITDKPTSGMAAFQKDAVVFMGEQGVVAAFVFPSVLSIPMAMDELVPAASDAVSP